MRLVARLFMLALGLSLAVPAGALTLFVGMFAEPAAHQLMATWGTALLDAIFDEAGAGGAPEILAGVAVMGLWMLALTLLVAPPAFTALIGEVIGTRAFAWYGGVCGLLTALLPWLLRSRGTLAGLGGAEGRLTALLFFAGGIAGLVYWAVSGRSAGRPPQVPPPPPWPAR